MNFAKLINKLTNGKAVSPPIVKENAIRTGATIIVTGKFSSYCYKLYPQRFDFM